MMKAAQIPRGGPVPALIPWCQRLYPALALLGGLALGCGSTAVRAGADWERGVDLSAGKKFSVERSGLLPANLTPDQLQLVQLIEDTTKAELTRKGYQQAPKAEAQLIATAHFTTRERTGINTYVCDNYWRYEMYEGAVLPAGAVPPCQESVLSTFEEATLLIDVYDTQRKELVFHGWAAAKRPEAGSTGTPALVKQATLDIMDRFPP
jgi:hypothetical protein